MIISHRLKYMFVHTPKTGGTSIRNVINNNDIFQADIIGQCNKNKTTISDLNNPKVDTNIWSHSSLKEGVNYLKNNNYKPNEYFKFLFIRNPWDRIVSAYEHQKQILFKNKGESFEEFLCKIINNNFWMDMFYDEKNYQLDFMGKFENIFNDSQTIFQKILKEEYQSIDIPHLNATKRYSYENYYNEETKKIIEEKFSKTIKLGNYSF